MAKIVLQPSNYLRSIVVFNDIIFQIREVTATHVVMVPAGDMEGSPTVTVPISKIIWEQALPVFCLYQGEPFMDLQSDDTPVLDGTNVLTFPSFGPPASAA